MAKKQRETSKDIKGKELKKAAEKTVEIDIKKEYIVLAVSVILFVGSLAFFLVSGSRSSCSAAQTGMTALSPEAAAQKAVDWINAYLKSQGANVKVSLISAAEIHGIYEFNIRLETPQGSKVITQYVTKDGALLLPTAIDTANIPKTANMSEVEKTEKPKVELFVMSYCPFGLQAEKAIIPVLRLLGNKIDFQVRFVDYAMHGEKEVWENLRQYCIEHKVAPEKYIDYLTCFVQEGNAEECLDKANIDAGAVQNCMDQLDKEYNISGILSNRAQWVSGQFPRFPLDAALNQKYGVRGSPTLVINGTVVQAPRNPEGLKELICSAFKSPPPECNKTLPSENVSPGFGPIEATGASAGGSCG